MGLSVKHIDGNRPPDGHQTSLSNRSADSNCDQRVAGLVGYALITPSPRRQTRIGHKQKNGFVQCFDPNEGILAFSHRQAIFA
jgi:hypothetical protein